MSNTCGRRVRSRGLGRFFGSGRLRVFRLGSVINDIRGRECAEDPAKVGEEAGQAADELSVGEDKDADGKKQAHDDSDDEGQELSVGYIFEYHKVLPVKE
jgi:hypothetical protein